MTSLQNIDPPMMDPQQNEDRLEELSDQLNDALESMQRGESPKHFSADPAFQAAVKLHVLTSESTPDVATRHGIEQRILERCADAQKQSRRHWAHWLVPLVSAGAVAVVVFAISAGKNAQPLPVQVALQNINSVFTGQDAQPTNTATDDSQQHQPTNTGNGGSATTHAFVPTTNTLLTDADALNDVGLTEEITDLETLEEEFNASMQDAALVMDQLNALQETDAEVESVDSELLQLSSL